MLTNLELLRTFLATASAATFREAAAQRHVTRSAVSQQIKTLEAQVGVTLFERDGRHARLTETGRALADGLRPSFVAIDELVGAIAAQDRAVAGEVRIGAPGPFTRLWILPRIIRLRAKHPSLELSVVFGTPRELERRLAEGDLDLVVLVRPVEHPAITSIPIFTETFRAYAAPAYLAAHGSPRSPADFAAHPFIVYDEDLPMHGPWWRATFGSRRAPMARIACRIANLYEMLALAEASVGLVVLPDYFTTTAIKRRTLVELPKLSFKPKSSAKNQIVLAWRTRATLTARLRTVREALAQ